MEGHPLRTHPIAQQRLQRSTLHVIISLHVGQIFLRHRAIAEVVVAETDAMVLKLKRHKSEILSRLIEVCASIYGQCPFRCVWWFCTGVSENVAECNAR